MKWQSTWKYFVRSAAVALVHPCTRDISAPARHFKANPQDSGFSGRRGHGWTRGCGRRNPQLRRGALYTDVLRPSAITPGAFGTWRQNRRERILLGTSLYLAFQAIMLRIMFKTRSLRFCERPQAGPKGKIQGCIL